MFWSYSNSIIMKHCGAAEMSWPANPILHMQKDVFVWLRLQPNVTSSWFNYSRLQWKRKLSYRKRNVICFHHIKLHRYSQDFTRKQNPPNWEALCCKIAPTARRILPTEKHVYPFKCMLCFEHFWRFTLPSDRFSLALHQLNQITFVFLRRNAAVPAPHWSAVVVGLSAAVWPQCRTSYMFKI